MQELEKVDGIEKITTFDSVYMTATFSGESGSITSISDFFPTLNREQTEEKQAVLSSEQQITTIWLRKMEYWLQKI